MDHQTLVVTGVLPAPCDSATSECLELSAAHQHLSPAATAAATDVPSFLQASLPSCCLGLTPVPSPAQGSSHQLIVPAAVPFLHCAAPMVQGRHGTVQPLHGTAQSWHGTAQLQLTLLGHGTIRSRNTYSWA